MRIGLAQMQIAFEDKITNQETCRRFFADAKKQGVDFLLFPEMSLTGFSMHTSVTGESMENAPTLTFFQEQAKENGIAVCFGMVDNAEEKAVNRCIILDKNGRVLANYGKIHPFSYGAEAAFFKGGDALAFCELEGIPICPTICYDLRFPELYQAASKQAKLITVIANWPTVRREHWILLLKARAIENQCFIAAVNATGFIKKLEYPGDSMVIDPYGHVITPDISAEALLTCDLDMSLVEQYRREFPLKNDRREDIYQKLYQW